MKQAFATGLPMDSIGKDKPQERRRRKEIPISQMVIVNSWEPCTMIEPENITCINKIVAKGT